MDIQRNNVYNQARKDIAVPQRYQQGLACTLNPEISLDVASINEPNEQFLTVS